MSNAQMIIKEIWTYLDKALYGKIKVTDEELRAFVEEKWAQADDSKYEIYNAYIICGRMVNEYASLKDTENVKRWLSMMDRHKNSAGTPSHIRSYYRGECFFKCGAEEEAFRHLLLCHEEAPDYIHERVRSFSGTRSYELTKRCADFFDKRMGIEPEAAELPNEKEYYSGHVRLTSWEKFFGEGKIFYDIGGDDPKYRMSSNHKRGLQYISDNQQEILNSMLDELYDRYPELQELYGYTNEEKAEYMPDITDKDELADLITPVSIHVLSVHKDGMPYIGYQFSCDWDREHGLGFMMFRDRVVEMDGADCSFLSWIAKKDLKSDK